MRLPVATRYKRGVSGVPVVGVNSAQLTSRTSGAYRVRAGSSTCCGPCPALSAVVLATNVPTHPVLTLYPNPPRTRLWVERSPAAPTATVERLEVTGRVVWHGTMGGGTQQVPAGLYLVRLCTATQLPLNGTQKASRHFIPSLP